MSSPTTPRRPPTSSTCSRWAGRSWRGSPTAATYDLSRHAEFSGEKLEYFDQDKGEAYVPHVIEPSLGVDRSLLAFLVDAYDTEEVEGRKRTVLRLHPRLAPVKVAVLPLVSKAGMPEKAREIYEQVRAAGPGRVRRGRLDRPPLPAPGRDRHPLGDHRGRPDDGGRHGDAARPRQPRAGAGPRRRTWPTAWPPSSPSRGGARSWAEQARRGWPRRAPSAPPSSAATLLARLAAAHVVTTVAPCAQRSPRGRRYEVERPIARRTVASVRMS